MLQDMTLPSTRLVIMFGLLILVIFTFRIVLYAYQELVINKNKDKNGEEIIDEEYIHNRYNFEKVASLLSGDDIEENSDDPFHIIFINKKDINDIRLPYQFLSPKESIKNSDGQNIDFNFNVNDYYVCQFYYNKYDREKSFIKINDETMLEDMDLTLFEYPNEINNHLLSKMIDESRDHIFKESNVYYLMQKYDFDAIDLIQYLDHIFESIKPSEKQIMNFLIQCHKMLDELKQIDLIDRNEKINQALNEYQSQSHQTNKTQLKNELKDTLNQLK